MGTHTTSEDKRLSGLEEEVARIQDQIRMLERSFRTILSPEPETGKASIDLDDCKKLEFTLEEASPGQQTKFSFQKAGNESWVETVKYSHRNGTEILVQYTRDGSVTSIADAPLAGNAPDLDQHSEELTEIVHRTQPGETLVGILRHYQPASAESRDLWELIAKRNGLTIVSGVRGDIDVLLPEAPADIVILLKQQEEPKKKIKFPSGEELEVDEDGFITITDDNRETKVGSCFKLREFQSKDGSNKLKLSPKLIELLECIKKEIDRPIIITSGYRTPAHNKKVGGKPESTHVTGEGADIKSGKKEGDGEAKSDDEVAKAAEKCLKDLKIKGGLGRYKDGHVHVDVKEDPPDRRWDDRKKK